MYCSGAAKKEEDVEHLSQRRRASLVENFEGDIQNPLIGIPRAELIEMVTKFQKDKGLPEDILPLLQKGALVAQDPAGFEEMADLDAADKTALRDEVLHRWKHPWALYYTIILNSIAAAIQGWDQVSKTHRSHRVLLGVANEGQDWIQRS